MNAPSTPKPAQALPGTTHEPRPKTDKLDLETAHKRISKRFPKALAELAK